MRREMLFLPSVTLVGIFGCVLQIHTTLRIYANSSQGLPKILTDFSHDSQHHYNTLLQAYQRVRSFQI